MPQAIFAKVPGFVAGGVRPHLGFHDKDALEQIRRHFCIFGGIEDLLVEAVLPKVDFVTRFFEAAGIGGAIGKQAPVGTFAGVSDAIGDQSASQESQGVIG